MKKTQKRNRSEYIKGQRIYLAPLLESDAEDMASWINDHEARMFLSRRMPISIENETEWIKKCNDEKNIVFAIMLKNDSGNDKLIGVIGAHNIDYIHGTCVTGANIGVKKHRCKGLGTEAKMIFLNYLFNWINMRKVCSEVFATNGASQKYSEKCGYVQEGVLTEQYYHNGSYIDLIQLAVFKDNFQKAWSAFIEGKPELK